MARFGYRSYRGSSRGKKAARALLIFLVLLLLFAVFCYFFLQRYLVYSQDGVYLDLPFLRTEQAQQPSSDGAKEPSMPPLQVSQPAEPSPEELTQSAPAEPPKLLRAITASPGELSGDGVPQALRVRMKESDANALVLEMKTEDGKLHYVSQVELAVKSGVSGTDETVNEAIRAASEEPDLWLIADISCFRDGEIPKRNHTLSIMTSTGYRWYDTEYIGWTNPYNSEAQGYVIALAKELAGLGFDEIRLSNCGFPVRGKVSLISYGKDSSTPFSAVVSGFLGQMREALSEYGVRLSVVSDTKTVLDGKNAASGQELSALALGVDRIYIPCKPEQLTPLSDAARAASPPAGESFFAAVLPSIPDGDYSWSLEK